jgi:hypothetical protein
MKTAMQELIEELEKRMKSYLSVDMALSASAIAITLMEAKKLLEKEKDQIVKAREDGNMFYLFKSNEQYLKQTYNN